MADEQLAPTAAAEPAEKPTPATAPAPPSTWLAFWQGLTTILTTAIETFGWTGALLICGFLFIVWYATDGQKQAIIDMYVLGKGVDNVWPLILIAGIFVCTSVAQYRWHKKEQEKLLAEVERVGKEKGKLQEKLLAKPLQHAKPRTKKGGK